MDTTAPRSTFVTVVGWIFTVLSGGAVGISVLQNLMLQLMFTQPEMQQAFQQPMPGAPPMAVFVMQNMRWLFLAFLVVAATMLAASIGLLQRRNWARLLFVGLMGLGIAWNIVGAVLQIAMDSPFPGDAGKIPAEMEMMLVVMKAATVVFALAFCGLFGSIAMRLLSPRIAAEFNR